MKINKLFILIYLIFFCNYSNRVFADDQDCLNKLLLNLFSIPSTSVTLCSDNEISTAQYFYKGTCLPGSQNLTDLHVESKLADPSSLSYKLEYNDLGCFSNLTTLTLVRLFVKAGFLGGDNNLKTAETVYIYYCAYYNQILTASYSISRYTLNIVIKVDEFSKLSIIDFKNFIHQKNFELIVSGSDGSTFPILSNTLDESSPYIMNLTSFKADVISFVSFAYFLCDQVTLNVYGTDFVNSSASLQDMGYINKLSLNFMNETQVDFPQTLGLPSNKFKNLTISGVFKKPSNYLQFSSSLQEFYIFNDSPNFNIDSNFPFNELKEPLKVISVGNLGLKIFPSNLPQSIESLKFDNNDFGLIELPDLSSYNNLKRVSLINCGFSQDISNRDDYCLFDALLNNNNLGGTQPQCMVCYKNDTANHLTGNINLLEGSCMKGSIVPNLILDSTSNYLYLHGVNLGLKPPVVDEKSINGIAFQLVQSQKLFRTAWDSKITLPKTISLHLGSNNDLFIVPTRQLLPTLSYVIKSGIDFTFSGLDFSYNASNYKVMIQDTKCYTVYIEYYSLSCSLKDGDLLPSIERLNGTIKNLISGETLNFFMNNTIDQTSYICQGCNNGMCNQITGICICRGGYQGEKCDQVAPLQCSSDCGESLGKGSCNTTIGECSCIQKWIGNSCQTPNQFLTSASSTFTNGGIVNLVGWFGTPNVDLSIKIGNLNCEIKTYNETFANCSIEAGSGTKSITVSQNGKTYTANNLFHYDELVYKCPKDCSLNGIQNGECIKSTGECKCYQNWAGYDCNSKSDVPSTSGGNNGNPNIPQSNTTINGTDGSTTISNQQTSYEISILSLVELDILDNVVLTHNLENKWKNNNSLSTNNNIHIFTQNITESCTLVYTIEDVKEAREFQFAGLKLSLDKDTVKMTVKINNYPFTNALNKLQLRLESKVGDDGKKECNSKDTQIDSSQIDKDQLLNYIKISKNEKILYGRYLNRVLSDNRESFITTTLISNSTSTNSNSSNKDSIIIGLNLPFFTNSLIIDPDFSVLTSPSFKKCNSSNASWVLPVAIVVPCVGVAAIIIITAILVKKNHTSVLIIKNKLKSLAPKKNPNLYIPTENELNKL